MDGRDQGVKRKQQHRRQQVLLLRQQAAHSQQAPTGAQHLPVRGLQQAGTLRAGRKRQQPMLSAPRPQHEAPRAGPPHPAPLGTGA